MQTILTHQGKNITVLSQSELRGPLASGEYVRAYCAVHGSDHQRSLSIHRSTGWGHCFNASCDATVLVTEWNPAAAEHLLQVHEQPASYTPSSSLTLPTRLQPIAQHIPVRIPEWQQNEQSTLLSLEKHLQAALSRSQRAQAYLEERGIPLHVAQNAGVGYLSPEIAAHLTEQGQHSLVRRWATRIVFPLHARQGRGYIGRSLWSWKPGVNEQAHKTLLERPGGPRRWIKTNPAGWFSCPFDQYASRLILVEGAFDRLTLLAAGFDASEVVALGGTTLHSEWLPPQAKTIILALDSDQGGRAATRRIATLLIQKGLMVKICTPPQDMWGKDWNERWHLLGEEGTWPLREAYFSLHSA